MRYLLIGPGYGHNIVQFLDFFDDKDEFDLCYLSATPLNFSRSYKKIKFFLFGFVDVLKLTFFIVRGDFDVIWLHGGVKLSLLVGLWLRLFNRKKTLSVFNVWGEGVNLKSRGSWVYRFLSRFFFKGFDLVQFNWFHVEDDFSLLYPKMATKTLPWGVSSGYFKDIKLSAKKEIDQIMQDFSSFEVKMFFPKSITSHSNHCALIDALGKLDGNWVLLILEGNGRAETEYQDFMEKVSENNLSDRVFFLNFSSYLDYSSIFYLWCYMDIGLQIVNNDQLSNTLIEPIIAGKKVVASNLRPYKLLCDLYDIDLCLVENEPDKILDGIRRELSMSEKGSIDRLLKNKKNLLKNYVFEENLEKIISYHKGFK